MEKLHRPKVLIVDDDPYLLVTLRHMLESMDCTVFTATDGKVALNVIQQEAITIIITDMRMPNMGGGALLDTVEALNLNIPVIVMTGFSDVTEAEIEERNGVVLLEKPFSKKKLNEIVNVFIRNLPSQIPA